MPDFNNLARGFQETPNYPWYDPYGMFTNVAKGAMFQGYQRGQDWLSDTVMTPGIDIGAMYGGVSSKRFISPAEKFKTEMNQFREGEGGVFNQFRLVEGLEKWLKQLKNSPEKTKATKYLNEYYSGKEHPDVALEVAAEWIHEALRKVK